MQVPVAGSVYAAAVAALDAGLSVVPVRADGSKAPAVPWSVYQRRLPTCGEVDGWFADGHPGLGLVCGKVSGGLELLEFEARATKPGGVLARFIAACRDAGLEELLDRITAGWTVKSPSGGLHLLYRCPDGVEGNLRLAATADGVVLVETRGEGGFAVIAPSHGPVHPTGRPWELIQGGFGQLATITGSERAELHRIARSFDEHRHTISTAAPTAVAAVNGDRPGDRFNAVHTCGDVLVAAGFTLTRTDPNGDRHYTRPGKDPRHGTSATVWADNQRATLWSTSIDAPKEAIGNRNLDAWQLHVHLNHRGDFTAAARDETRRHPPRPVDQATGEIVAQPSAPPAATIPTLPDEFWEARPALDHIRQAARSRRTPPDTVLGCVLARIAARIPHTVKLPGIVGSPVGLSYFLAAIAPSGGGKTSGMAVAAEIIPATGDVVEVPGGTGEGVIETLYGKDDDGQRVQVRYAAIVNVDEGSALLEIASRQGSTIMSVLRQGYTDGPIGNTNATPERRRIIPRGQYVIGLTVGFQPVTAAPLLDDAEAGTPQRFTWLANYDPGVPDRRPDWPDQLRWTPPPIDKLSTRTVGNYVRHIIPVPAAVIDEIDRRRVRQLRGDNLDGDPLDTHAGLVTLKTAALLAILDSRFDITEDDWRLANIVYDTSAAVRRHVADRIAAHRAQEEQSRLRRLAAREAHLEDAAAARALASGAMSIARRVHKHGEATRRDLHFAVYSAHRKLVALDDMIERAEADDLIRRDGAVWRPGRRTP